MDPPPATASAGAEATTPATGPIESAREGSRRRRPRWRKWVVLGLVLLALRVAVPIVVAPLVASRLSRALGTRVEIGDLSFQPVDAIFTLRDVTVHAPAQPGAPADAAPPIVADRVRIDVQWLPLLHQRLRVRELVLESARVDLDRFPDGGFGLANLEHADPASELPSGWSFALDNIALRDSRLRVRDLAAGHATLLEATVRTANVSAMQRRAPAFGKATNLRVDALVGSGRLHVHGRYALRDDGLVLDALVLVKDVPLAQAKSYVADLGWTDLSGQLSGRLRWQREPRRRDLLSGRVVLRRGSVQVAGLTEPALRVRRGVVDVAAIDLLARRIAIASLTLHGSTLALRPDADAPIPLIAAPLLRPPPRESRQDAATRLRAESGSRWTWMIERFETAGSRVRVVAPDGSFDLLAHVSGENLGPGAYWSPLRMEVADRETTAAFDGTLRLGRGLTIEGHLTAGGIDFRQLARAAGLPWAEFVQTGRATADLTLQFDTAAEDGSPLFARGGMALTDLWVAGLDPSAFILGAARVDLTLDGFSPRASGGAGGRPTRISIADATVSAPFVLLTRTTGGWATPPTATSSDDTPEIALGTLRGAGGSVTVIDLIPNPPITWNMTRVDGSAHGLSLPASTFDRLELRGSDPNFGTLQLGVSRRAGATEFELSGHGVSLAATYPYLNFAGLPYYFASGTGSFTVRGSIDPARWAADAALTLRAPTLAGSDTDLENAIGMPVPSALALLRDQSGDITLQVTLASEPAAGGTYADQVAAGVRDTINRVREAAQGAGGFAPVNVLFAPGQIELNRPATQQLASVARLLGARPGLVVELAPETSDEDRRWLAEQALRGEFEESGGVMGVLRALGIRDQRDRIRGALAARARGAPGRLDADDEAELTRLLAAAPPIGDGPLAALREARLTRVVNHFADHYGISGKRVVVRSVAPGESGALAAVRVRIMIAPDPSLDGARGSPPPAAADSMKSSVPAAERLE